MSDSAELPTLRETLMALATARGNDKTYCPSEAARLLGGPHPDGWGPMMQPIRKEAVSLALEGRLVIYRKGVVPSIRSISKGFIGWGCQGSISL